MNEPIQIGLPGANRTDEHRRLGAATWSVRHRIMETTEKQRAIEALKTLSDQATMEDAIERLCFIAKIEEGLRQSEAGQLMSHDEETFDVSIEEERALLGAIAQADRGQVVSWEELREQLRRSA